MTAQSYISATLFDGTNLSIANIPTVTGGVLYCPDSGNFPEFSLLSTIITPRSQASASRSLNSVFQVSATKDCMINYSVDVATSATLIGGQTGTVYLEIASNSGFTNNVQELCRFVNGNSVSLAIAITVTQNVTGILSGFVPAGYYVRLRTQNNTGTPTFTYRSGQEVTL